MIVSTNVNIDGVELVRWSSDADVKIKCVQDGNVYPVAYVTKNATVSFDETNIPLNEISAGVPIYYSDVIGLSGYIVDTLDVMWDGKINDTININSGDESGNPDEIQ